MRKRERQMPRAILTSITIATASMLSVSCGSTSETVTAPSPTRCGVAVQSESLSFAPDGGGGTIRIATSRECSWVAQSEAGWVTLSQPVSGQGDGAVQFTVASNGDPAPRATGVTVQDQRLQISQGGRPCEFRLSTTVENVEAAGGERTVQVAVGSAQCRWTVSADVPWITLLSSSEGSGSGAVRFRVDAASGPQRTGTITIAGQAVRVEQGTGCSYTIGVDALTLGAAGGAGEVPVSASPGCAWNAQSQVPWITLTTASAGSGSGTVGFSVAASDGPTRTGTLTVAGRVVTITQAPGCTFLVEPLSHAAPTTGGPALVTVRAAAACAWTASSTVEWITVTAGQTGAGNGEVRFTVAASAGPARSGSLRVAGQTVNVTQGSGCTITVAPPTVSIPAAATTGTIQVASAQGCTWSAASNAPWITITGGSSGSGNGQVQFSAAANVGPVREASLSIGERTIPVTQASGCTYTVTPPTLDVAGTGGPRSASIATAAGCPWTASSGVAWITVATPSGSGPAQVTFTVAPNLSPARTGSLTVAGGTLTVNQASQCQWTMVPPNHVFDSGGGNGFIQVLVTGPCTWTAVSNDSWITLVSGGSGTGNGLVHFRAAQNNGPARAGTLTIAGQRYDVSQSGR
jgi:Putative binding domain, N-terminal/Viral BACON domain